MGLRGWIEPDLAVYSSAVVSWRLEVEFEPAHYRVLRFRVFQLDPAGSCFSRLLWGERLNYNWAGPVTCATDGGLDLCLGHGYSG